MRRTALLLLLAALAFSICAEDASGQLGAGIALREVEPTTGFGLCSIHVHEPRVLDVLDTRRLQPDDARVALRRLQEAFAAEAVARPDDVEVQYALAAVLGSRAEVEGGRTRVRAAQAMHSQATRVLALDPDHAGAHYLMGRLHAGVMRMDRLTRFVATRILGGGALAGASWDEARAQLEAAVLGDPCVPEHHYELARLYADRGQTDLAIDQLENLGQLPATTPFLAAFTQGMDLMNELRGGPGER